MELDTFYKDQLVLLGIYGLFLGTYYFIKFYFFKKPVVVPEFDYTLHEEQHSESDEEQLSENYLHDENCSDEENICSDSDDYSDENYVQPTKYNVKLRKRKRNLM